MKKKNAVIMAISLTSLICLVLFAFISYYTSMNRKISKDLNSSIPITLEFEYKDSHHWFLGDGATRGTVLFMRINNVKKNKLQKSLFFPMLSIKENKLLFAIFKK
ncbi:hypothetical protein EUAN_23900 [Andreesenia angusta]|uniref:Uncharacterized protein n=1 Tax=Andreesenia angusta TaxID=39480 RepID=A0A1S1V3I5_9FIRM|nr:hypothetical protein [Andreesenia angusta]OHW61266.1 hypothetical protein EUAN_23900 [Andreesenia angusta]